METNNSAQDVCFFDNGSHDFFTVNVSTYKPGPPDPSLFALPDGCDRKACPTGVQDCDDPAIPTAEDWARAKNWVPRPEYKGPTMGQASTVLNGHLRNARLLTQSCDLFSLDQLDSIQTRLYSLRAADLIEVYDMGHDPRRPRLNSLQEYQELWAKMQQTAKTHPQTYDVLRDGRCRETVMWYTHHLTANGKQQIRGNLVLPLLPTAHHGKPLPTAHTSEQWAYDQYSSMVTCQQCHL